MRHPAFVFRGIITSNAKIDWEFDKGVFVMVLTRNSVIPTVATDGIFPVNQHVCVWGYVCVCVCGGGVGSVCLSK